MSGQVRPTSEDDCGHDHDSEHAAWTCERNDRIRQALGDDKPAWWEARAARVLARAERQA